MRKPYWFSKLKCWYIKDSAGRSVRLDPDKDTAFEMWHDMSQALKRSGANATMLGICDAFLADQKSSTQYKALERYAVSFCKFYRGRVDDLTKSIVSEWLESPKPGRKRKDGSTGPEREWAQHSKRDAAATIRRICRWAHGEGLISRNPLHDFRAPEPEPRQAVITAQDHARLVADAMASKDHSFVLVLIALRCGARPQQIRDVQVSNCIGNAWVFRSHKTKRKTSKPLTVYLSPCLQTLSNMLCDIRGDGHLFLNGNSEPWKKDGICRRFARMREKLKLPSDLVPYSYRHAFATDALAAGLHVTSVSQLLGHKDTRMVTKVYGHLEQVESYLTDEAAKVAKHRATPKPSRRTRNAQ